MWSKKAPEVVEVGVWERPWVDRSGELERATAPPFSDGSLCRLHSDGGPVA
jgi:hypothetical protein